MFVDLFWHSARWQLISGFPAFYIVYGKTYM